MKSKSTMRLPQKIGEEIAEAGALIGLGRDGVIRATTCAIREERRDAVYLSQGELRAVLNAISQMTDGNARDYYEWRKCTHGSYGEWRALLRAEATLIEALNPKKSKGRPT